MAGTAVAGAVVAVLSLIAMMYGVYLAHLTGWGGLDVRDLGEDAPAQLLMWTAISLLATPVMGVGAILGVVGTFRR